MELSRDNTTDSTGRPLKPGLAPRLDTTFPSVKLMAAAIGFIVLVSIISGFKIVRLDHDQEELRLERAVFEKDRAALGDYKSEMPALEQLHTELRSVTADMQARHDALAEELKGLEQQRQEVRTVLDEARGEYYRFQGARQEAQQEMAKIVNEISAIQPLTRVYKTQMEVLKIREAEAREGINKLLAQKEQLSADLKGLEREKAHAQEFLERVLNDRKVLQNFAEAVGGTANELKQTAKNADAATKNFVDLTAGLEASVQQIKTGAQTIPAKMKNIDEQAASLAASNKTLAAVADQGERAGRLFQGQVDSLAASGASLKQGLRDMETQTSKWALGSEKTLAELKAIDLAVAPLPKSVAAALKNLTDATGEVSLQAARLKTLEEQLATLAASNKTLAAAAEQGEKTGRSLQSQVDSLAASGAALKQSLKDMETQTAEWAKGSAKTLADLKSIDLAVAPLPKSVAAALKNLTDATGEVSLQAARLKTLEEQLATLAASNKTLAAAAEQGEKTGRSLQSQVDSLTASAAALKQSLKDMETQTAEWAKGSAKTLADLKSIDLAVAPLPKSVAAALKNLSDTTRDLSAQTRLVEGSAKEVQNLVAPLKSQTTDLAQAGASLKNEASNARGAGAELQRQIAALQKNIDAANAAVQKIQASLVHAETAAPPKSSTSGQVNE